MDGSYYGLSRGRCQGGLFPVRPFCYTSSVMKFLSGLVFRGYDLRVVTLLLLAAILLGVLNNLRQPSEQRVAWFAGEANAEPAGEDGEPDAEEGDEP